VGPRRFSARSPEVARTRQRPPSWLGALLADPHEPPDALRRLSASGLLAARSGYCGRVRRSGSPFARPPTRPDPRETARPSLTAFKARQSAPQDPAVARASYEQSVRCRRSAALRPELTAMPARGRRSRAQSTDHAGGPPPSPRAGGHGERRSGGDQLRRSARPGRERSSAIWWDSSPLGRTLLCKRSAFRPSMASPATCTWVARKAGPVKQQGVTRG